MAIHVDHEGNMQIIDGLIYGFVLILVSSLDIGLGVPFKMSAYAADFLSVFINGLFSMIRIALGLSSLPDGI